MTGLKDQPSSGLKKGKRITIVMDFDVVKKLRKIQSDKIKNSEGTISFSYVVNNELRKSLKL